MRIVRGSKTFSKFQTYEKCDRKFTHKILKESRVAIASAERLGSHSSNLIIIILSFIT